MTFRSRLPVALIAATFPFTALADTLHDGYYHVAFEGAQGSLLIADGQASVSLGSMTCAGSAAGPLSALIDRVATFTARDNDESCTMAITVDDNGTPVLIEETDSGCWYFHGASCSFHGEVLGPEVPFSIEAIDAGFNALSRDARLEAQEILRDRGFYAGAIDATTGRNTRLAIVGAAREDLTRMPDLRLDSEERVRIWLLALANTEATEPAQAPAAEPVPTVADIGTVAPEPAATDGTPTWLGDWRCESGHFEGTARFTFDQDRATFHNLGITMDHAGVQSIGQRSNALTLEFADGEIFGLFDIGHDSMIITASAGIFDCTR